MLIDREPGAPANRLEELTEAELVAKGQAALTLMGIEAADAPRETQFCGVRKLRNGGIVYEMNSAASAEWLKQKGVIENFLSKYNGAAIIKNRAYTVVIEFVPTTLNLEEKANDEFLSIETANNMQSLTILSAKWIKPPHQQTRGP